MHQATADFLEVLFVIWALIFRFALFLIAELKGLEKNSARDAMIVLFIVEMNPPQTLPYKCPLLVRNVEKDPFICFVQCPWERC